MAGVNAPVIHVNVIVGNERQHAHLLHLVVMVVLGKPSAMHGQGHIHTVPIHSASTQVSVCHCASLTTSSLSNLEAMTMKATTNRFVAGATTTRLPTMAVGAGVGAKKVFVWGWRPAGYSCAFTREIRQGGGIGG